MDPEDLREVISAYQKCVAETLGRFKGFVAKYMGMGFSFTSAFPKPTRMTQRGPSVQGWSWWRL
jgi:class 3 adenylate cyclase